MNRKRILLAACVLVCWTGSVFGQTLPASKRPEDAGFSSERLARVTLDRSAGKDVRHSNAADAFRTERLLPSRIPRVSLWRDDLLRE
jgi:hypothetical protein